MQAVGSNPDAARLSGIPTSWVRLQTLMLMGAICGLSGVMYVGFRGAIDPNEGSDFVLVVVAAVIIGGTPLSGGHGTVIGAVVGMLIIQIISSGLIFFGIDATWSTVVTGAVIVLAVSLDQLIRMQRLRRGPLVDAGPGIELWLDGGHNPAGGQALAATLAAMPPRVTHAICGMLNTKDIAGYLRPLAPHLAGLSAVSIPGEANTLPADQTATVARAVGIPAVEAEGVLSALQDIAARDPAARVLICGSLYLAGAVLRDNG